MAEPMTDDVVLSWEVELRRDPQTPNWFGIEAMIARIRADAVTIARQSSDLSALENVASAARELCSVYGSDYHRPGAAQALANALSALDAARKGT